VAYGNNEYATTQTKISTTASATIVSNAAAGKKVLVCELVLVAAGSVVVTLEDSDGTDISGPMSMVAGTPLVLPMNAVDGHCETPAAKGFGLALGSAVQVSGYVRTRLVS